MSSVSRRGFLAGAALLGAGSLLGCSASAKEDGSAAVSWDEEAEVVIIGGGGSGLAAAISAVQAGSTAVVFEKGSATGGSSALSGGCVQAADTPNQKAEGIEDAAENHAEMIIQTACGNVDEDLVRAMTAGGADVIAWFEDLGMVWDPHISCQGQIPYANNEKLYVPRGHEPLGGMGSATGVALTDVLLASAQELGVDIRLKTPVTQIIRDEASGDVVGVVADGKNVKANKGVVICAGGIDRGEELARKYSPYQSWNLAAATASCCATNTGDGIQMGLEVDAAFRGPSGPVSGNNMGCGIYRGETYPCVFVNPAGKRFVAEDGAYGYYALMDYEERMKFGGDKPIWCITDANGMAEAESHPWTSVAGIPVYKDTELLIQAESIEELAEMINPEIAENIVSTVAEWNTMIERDGKDTMFNRDSGIAPLTQAPFYAALVLPGGSLGCTGGLQINTRAEVVDNAGNVIPRLYAAGLSSSGWLGRFYPGSGTALLGAYYWGRVAGANAAGATA